MRKYQEYLHQIQRFANDRSCLATNCNKVNGMQVVVYSGVYDGEAISYCHLPYSLLKEDSISKFRPLGSYTSLERVIYSKSTKSLLALVRKHLKEEV